MTAPHQQLAYTYDTAPNSPELAGLFVSSRMLKRAVEQQKISYLKFGNRVTLTSAHLAEYVERHTTSATKR